MERLQEISTAIVIAIAIFGSLGWAYNIYCQPDLSPGKYFTNAWIDIKDEQITVYAEFVPDGKGRGVLAVQEVVCRVRDKSWWNPAIDGRPIVVVLLVRDGAVLLPLTAIVVYKKEACPWKPASLELVHQAMANMTILYNKTSIDIVNRSTGLKTSVDIKEYFSGTDTFIYQPVVL